VSFAYPSDHLANRRIQVGLKPQCLAGFSADFGYRQLRRQLEKSVVGVWVRQAGDQADELDDAEDTQFLCRTDIACVLLSGRNAVEPLTQQIKEKCGRPQEKPGIEVDPEQEKDG